MTAGTEQLNNNLLDSLIKGIFLPLRTSFWGALNYGIAYLAALSAAASVAAWTTMASVCLVGGAILAIPMVLLGISLELLGVLTEPVLYLLDYAFYFGSIATGAAYFGLAIEPFIICASITPMISAVVFVISLIVGAALGYFLSSNTPNNAPESVPLAVIRQPLSTITEGSHEDSSEVLPVDSFVSRTTEARASRASREAETTSLSSFFLDLDSEPNADGYLTLSSAP
jgi:hypothetical protein